MVKCVETEFERQYYEEAPIDTVKVPITEKLIWDSLTLQLPTGEEGKYARLVKLDVQTIKQLKLEYKSITFIDNLSTLVNLTKLQLCNNVIVKIEKLDELVNLTWLDLSFNSIRKIENINHLKKLEVLDLHRNFIASIENMDNLLRLELFHISSNKLENLENVKYLRRFVRLRSASFEGNPISKNPNFLSYLVAFVPQLSMVDYHFIPSHEREVSTAKYKSQMDKLATENKLIRRASVVEATEQVTQLHKDIFVDGFKEDRFWHDLYENDAEGKVLLQLQPGDSGDIFSTYKDLFRKKSKEMFNKGIKFYQKRENELKAYNTAIREEWEIVQKEGNALTEEFVEYGSGALQDMRILVGLMEDSERKLLHGLINELPPEFSEYESQLNDICREYIQKLHKIWATMLNNEVEFNEQLEEVNELLDSSVKEIIASWLEKLQEQFENMRELEQQLFEKLLEAVIPVEESSEEEEENEEDEEEEEEGEMIIEEQNETENVGQKVGQSVVTIMENVIDEVPNPDESKMLIDFDFGDDEEEENEDEDEEERNEENILLSQSTNLQIVELDSEEAQTYVETSHDQHVKVIDEKEKDLCEKINNWLDNFSENVIVKEYNRNRARLEEIAHFTNSHYGYLEDTKALHHTTVHIPNVHEDQECTDAPECVPLEWYSNLTKRIRAKDKKFKERGTSNNDESEEEAEEADEEKADGNDISNVIVENLN